MHVLITLRKIYLINTHNHQYLQRLKLAFLYDKKMPLVCFLIFSCIFC